MAAGRRAYRTSHQPARKQCIACKIHRDIIGELTRRGLCIECRTVHGIAQALGQTRVYYETLTINNVLISAYSGPVIKVA